MLVRSRPIFPGALCLVIALSLSGPVAGGDVFRWKDSQGRTHYSETPPDGAKGRNTGIAAQVPGNPPVAARKAPECQTVQCQYERMRRYRLEDEAAHRSERVARSQDQAARGASPRGMTFDVFARLERGMSEGEVMDRAGPPDHEAFDGALGAKTWSYLPTATDPFTTRVILRGGQVFEIDRIRRL